MSETKSMSVSPVDEVLPAGQMVTLGIQHVLVMYAGAIAVPLIMGGALHLSHEQIAFLVSADLFCSGVATIGQSLGIGKYFGIRMPVVMSISFAPVAPMIAIASEPGVGLPTILGATIVAGIIATIIAPLIGRMRSLFPPIVTGVVITSIGLSIIGVGIDWTAGGYGNPNYGAPVYLLTSASVLVFILLITRFTTGFMSNVAVLFGIIFGFIVAMVLGEVHFDTVAKVGWFGFIPPFHFGAPKFEFWACFTLTIVMIITFIESTGMFLALGELVDKPVEEADLNRGLRLDGLATIFGGIFNSFMHTSFAQNIGLVGITRVRSRYVTVTAGVILILLGFIPKMSALVASIPVFVLGGAGIVMFGMVMATGIRILADVDYKHNRYNSYIVAISLAMSLIPTISHNFFQHLPKFLGPFLHSGILIGALWAVALNIYFNNIQHYFRGTSFGKFLDSREEPHPDAAKDKAKKLEDSAN